jgi:hypothetical protein
MKLQFKRFFSVDSPKAIKAKKYRYLNAINYMAPHKSAGIGNLCSHASPGCINLCLGRESGQASMVSANTNWTNSTRDSRERKAHLDPKGVVVGLTPKGSKAKRDTSGFVVRQAA